MIDQSHYFLLAFFQDLEVQSLKLRDKDGEQSRPTVAERSNALVRSWMRKVIGSNLDNA